MKSYTIQARFPASPRHSFCNLVICSPSVHGDTSYHLSSVDLIKTRLQEGDAALGTK